MGRQILGVLAGVVAGGVVVALVEAGGHAAFPVRDGADLHNLQPGDVSNAAMASVLVAWALGALVAGWVAAWIAARPQALIAGAVLMAGGIANMVAIPSPLWFWIGGLLVFLPCAWLGSRLAPGRRPGH